MTLDSWHCRPKPAWLSRWPLRGTGGCFESANPVQRSGIAVFQCPVEGGGVVFDHRFLVRAIAHRAASLPPAGQVRRSRRLVFFRAGLSSRLGGAGPSGAAWNKQVWGRCWRLRITRACEQPRTCRQRQWRVCSKIRRCGDARHSFMKTSISICQVSSGCIRLLLVAAKD